MTGGRYSVFYPCRIWWSQPGRSQVGGL